MVAEPCGASTRDPGQMSSPVGGTCGQESFFSPGQAERGQAGAGGHAGVAGRMTAGACSGCAEGVGSRGEAGRGSDWCRWSVSSLIF